MSCVRGDLAGFSDIDLDDDIVQFVCVYNRHFRLIYSSFLSL